MTTEELKNKIGFQLNFLLLSEKSYEDTLNQLTEICVDFAEPLKSKANQWDALGEKIAKCYVDENGEELSKAGALIAAQIDYLQNIKK